MNDFRKYDENEIIRVVIKEYGEVYEGKNIDVEAVLKENYPDVEEIVITSRKEITKAYDKIMENIQILKDTGFNVSDVEREMRELYYNDLDYPED